MALSEQRAKELAEIEPPRSIERIVRFLDELGLRLDAPDNPVATEGNAAAPGELGRRAARMSNRIALGSQNVSSMKSLGEWIPFLMARYQIGTTELREFSLWLVKWNDKRAEVETIRIPEMTFAPRSFNNPDHSNDLAETENLEAEAQALENRAPGQILNRRGQTLRRAALTTATVAGAMTASLPALAGQPGNPILDPTAPFQTPETPYNRAPKLDLATPPARRNDAANPVTEGELPDVTTRPLATRKPRRVSPAIVNRDTPELPQEDREIQREVRRYRAAPKKNLWTDNTAGKGTEREPDVLSRAWSEGRGNYANRPVRTELRKPVTLINPEMKTVGQVPMNPTEPLGPPVPSFTQRIGPSVFAASLAGAGYLAGLSAGAEEAQAATALSLGSRMPLPGDGVASVQSYFANPGNRPQFSFPLSQPAMPQASWTGTAPPAPQTPPSNLRPILSPPPPFNLAAQNLQPSAFQTQNSPSFVPSNTRPDASANFVTRESEPSRQWNGDGIASPETDESEKNDGKTYTKKRVGSRGVLFTHYYDPPTKGTTEDTTQSPTDASATLKTEANQPKSPSLFEAFGTQIGTQLLSFGANWGLNKLFSGGANSLPNVGTNGISTPAEAVPGSRAAQSSVFGSVPNSSSNAMPASGLNLFTPTLPQNVALNKNGLVGDFASNVLPGNTGGNLFNPGNIGENRITPSPVFGSVADVIPASGLNLFTHATSSVAGMGEVSNQASNPVPPPSSNPVSSNFSANLPSLFQAKTMIPTPAANSTTERQTTTEPEPLSLAKSGESRAAKSLTSINLGAKSQFEVLTPRPIDFVAQLAPIQPDVFNSGSAMPLPGTSIETGMGVQNTGANRAKRGANTPSLDLPRAGNQETSFAYSEQNIAATRPAVSYQSLMRQIEQLPPETATQLKSLPQRDLLSGKPLTALLAQAATSAPNAGNRKNTPLEITPEMGLITLVAPPLQVASRDAEKRGVATALDWQTLVAGAGTLDEGGLAQLRDALPGGAQLLYPALPRGTNVPNAVNLRLAPNLLTNLLTQGYGNENKFDAKGMANQATRMATRVTGGTPSAQPLAARIVPTKPPAGSQEAPLGDAEPGSRDQSGALKQAGKGQATRGGALDFMGLPVRLAPSLGGRPELSQQVALRGGASPEAQVDAIRPAHFSALKNRLFPAFQSVAAEPDKAAWRKAAPAFRMRNADPTTLLSPDALAPKLTPSMPLPQSSLPLSARGRGLPEGLPPGALPPSHPLLVGMNHPLDLGLGMSVHPTHPGHTNHSGHFGGHANQLHHLPHLPSHLPTGVSDGSPLYPGRTSLPPGFFHPKHPHIGNHFGTHLPNGLPHTHLPIHSPKFPHLPHLPNHLPTGISDGTPFYPGRTSLPPGFFHPKHPHGGKGGGKNGGTIPPFHLPHPRSHGHHGHFGQDTPPITFPGRSALSPGVIRPKRPHLTDPLTSKTGHGHTHFPHRHHAPPSHIIGTHKHPMHTPGRVPLGQSHAPMISPPRSPLHTPRVSPTLGTHHPHHSARPAHTPSHSPAHSMPFSHGHAAKPSIATPTVKSAPSFAPILSQNSPHPTNYLPTVTNTPTPHTLSTPSVRPTPRLVLPSAGQSGHTGQTRHQPQTMTIQRATDRVTGASSGGGDKKSSPLPHAATSAAGGQATEVGLLANEVWALLKRKIARENERQGR